VATSNIFLIGGGGHASVVIDCLKAQGVNVAGVFDPLYKGTPAVPALGTYATSFDPAALAIIAIGNNTIRKRVSDQVTHGFENAIHPSALVSSAAKTGDGNMILHGAIVQANCFLGRHVIINTGATIDHDCRIEDFVHIAPGVVLCGNVQVGEGAIVGAGAVIIPGIKVGAWATIGAGSVVIRDVAPGACVVGNPARQKQS
jgi:sugar O-acyltransferase (sialic acid O-acetyltransferase NeuD family)